MHGRNQQCRDTRQGRRSSSKATVGVSSTPASTGSSFVGNAGSSDPCSQRLAPGDAPSRAIGEKGGGAARPFTCVSGLLRAQSEAHPRCPARHAKSGKQGRVQIPLKPSTVGDYESCEIGETEGGLGGGRRALRSCFRRHRPCEARGRPCPVGSRARRRVMGPARLALGASGRESNAIGRPFGDASRRPRRAPSRRPFAAGPAAQLAPEARVWRVRRGEPLAARDPQC